MSFLCKEFHSLTGQTIGRFTPLDAAGPVFDSCPSSARVDKSDADYVDFIHTDRNLVFDLQFELEWSYIPFLWNLGKFQLNSDSLYLLRVFLKSRKNVT